VSVRACFNAVHASLAAASYAASELIHTAVVKCTAALVCSCAVVYTSISEELTVVV
jgi:hypothetical protein